MSSWLQCSGSPDKLKLTWYFETLSEGIIICVELSSWDKEPIVNRCKSKFLTWAETFRNYLEWLRYSFTTLPFWLIAIYWKQSQKKNIHHLLKWQGSIYNKLHPTSFDTPAIRIQINLIECLNEETRWSM